jgi:glucose-fructose oxidoreductase
LEKASAKRRRQRLGCPKGSGYSGTIFFSQVPAKSLATSIVKLSTLFLPTRRMLFMKTFDQERRHLIQNLAVIAGASTMAPALALKGFAESSSKTKIGFALVGLGNYSTTMLAPALKSASNCYLAGIVTGSPEKALSWSKEYGIPEKNIYNYDNYDAIANNDDIDVIYVVLPNSMHAEFTIRALNAGKHVICEKPMALNSAEARTMIDAAKRADRKLSIGYRMHYDPYFIEVKRLGQKEILGRVNFMEATLAYYSTPEKNSWKLKKAMGGGSLYNLGVYPIQSARHTKGAEPVILSATANSQRKDLFSEVYEHFSWTMEFSDGSLCNCFTGSSSATNRLYAACEKGFIELNSATAYSGQWGSSSLGKFDYPQVFQQQLQMEDFARCILEKDASIVSGEDGLKDMLIIDAIHASILAGGARVKIG